MKKTIIILLLFISITKAEEPEIVNYLLNDTATMWDLGLLKTQIMLDKQNERAKKQLQVETFSNKITYENKKIIIDMTAYNVKDLEKKKNCTNFLQNMKFFLELNSYPNNFRHTNFLKHKEPKFFNNKINEITELHLTFWNKENNEKNFKPVFSCKSGLSKHSKFYFGNEQMFYTKQWKLVK